MITGAILPMNMFAIRLVVRATSNTWLQIMQPQGSSGPHHDKYACDLDTSIKPLAV